MPFAPNPFRSVLRGRAGMVVATGLKPHTSLSAIFRLALSALALTSLSLLAPASAQDDLIEIPPELSLPGPVLMDPFEALDADERRGPMDDPLLPAEDSQGDIVFKLKVERSGAARLKTNPFESDGATYWQSETDTEWVYGPYELETRLYANTRASETRSRRTILDGLRRWSDNQDHYLNVILSFATAQTRSGIDPPRKVYYDKISSEIVRLIEEAESANTDVNFLEVLLTKQRSYKIGSTQMGPHDPLSLVKSNVSFSGANAVERNVQQHRWMRPDADGARQETMYERTIAPAEFEVLPGWPSIARDDPNTSPPFRYVPNILIEVMELSGCETDHLQSLIGGLDARLDRMTPEAAGAFDFNAQEREWYETTTRPVLIRIFRETYRQAIYDAVRYAWDFSGEQMPRNMQLGAESAAAQALLWHRPYQDVDQDDYWVDENGVPIIKDGADLSLPQRLDGRHLHLYLAETGGPEPRSLNEIFAFGGLSERTITLNVPDNINHELLAWRRTNEDDRSVEISGNTPGQPITNADVSDLEPIWTGAGLTNGLVPDGGRYLANWNLPYASAIFEPAPVFVDTAEGYTEYWNAPRMHRFSKKNGAGEMSASLTLDYVGFNRSPPGPDNPDEDLVEQSISIDFDLRFVGNAGAAQSCLTEDFPVLAEETNRAFGASPTAIP